MLNKHNDGMSGATTDMLTNIARQPFNLFSKSYTSEKLREGYQDPRLSNVPTPQSMLIANRNEFLENAIENSPAELNKPFLKNPLKWKNNTNAYIKRVKERVSTLKTKDEITKFLEAIKNRIKRWDKKPFDTLETIPSANMFWAISVIFKNSSKANQLYIKNDLEGYIRKRIALFDSQEPDAQARNIERTRIHLNSWAGADFLERLPTKLGTKFVERFIASDVAVIESASAGVSKMGRAMGLGLIGLIGVTAIMQIGRKKKRRS